MQLTGECKEFANLRHAKINPESQTEALVEPMCPNHRPDQDRVPLARPRAAISRVDRKRYGGRRQSLVLGSVHLDIDPLAWRIIACVAPIWNPMITPCQ